MSEDEQIFLAAATLLTAAVGESHEPVDESQIRIAVLNAHSFTRGSEKTSRKNCGWPGSRVDRTPQAASKNLNGGWPPRKKPCLRLQYHSTAVLPTRQAASRYALGAFPGGSNEAIQDTGSNEDGKAGRRTEPPSRRWLARLRGLSLPVQGTVEAVHSAENHHGRSECSALHMLHHQFMGQ